MLQVKKAGAEGHTLYDPIGMKLKKRKYVIRSQERLPWGHKKASGGLVLFLL